MAHHYYKAASLINETEPTSDRKRGAGELF